MRVPVIVGAGAIGTWLAVRLTHGSTQQVVLLARPERAALLREHGARMEVLSGVDPEGVGGAREAGPGLRVVSDPQALPSDPLVVFAVRAYQTKQAARMLEDSGISPWGVVTLQNGLGNAEALADSFSVDRVAVGTTSHGVLWVPPAGVRHTGRGDTTLGPWTPSARPVAQEAARWLEKGGLHVELVEDPRPALWRKVAVNAAINPPTAVHEVENGALLDGGPLEQELRMAAREVARVAQAEEIDLSEDEAEQTAHQVAARTARNRSSMLQARMAGRPLETDAITGEVVKRARRHGIDVPVNEAHLDRLRRLVTPGAT